MLRKRFCVAALTAAGVALAIAAPSAATPPAAASGTAVPTSAAYFPKQLADGNVILDFAGTHAWSGSFTGTSTIGGQLVQHATGELTFQGSLTFTGSTPCGAGTVQFDAKGSGPLPGPVTGRAVTIDQGGSTVSIRANLEIVLFLLPQGAVVTYSGDVHCD